MQADSARCLSTAHLHPPHCSCLPKIMRLKVVRERQVRCPGAWHRLQAESERARGGVSFMKGGLPLVLNPCASSAEGLCQAVTRSRRFASALTRNHCLPSPCHILYFRNVSGESGLTEESPFPELQSSYASVHPRRPATASECLSDTHRTGLSTDGGGGSPATSVSAAAATSPGWALAGEDRSLRA